MVWRLATLFFYITMLFLNAAQDDNISERTFAEYIDENQKNFSKTVTNLFDTLDSGISGWIDDDDDENITCDDIANKLNEDFFQDQGSIDAFFKSDKFIDDTEASFLRIRLGSEFQSKEPAEFKYKIRAQIPLSRTKKSFQIFVGDVEKNYFDTTTSTEVKEKKTEVGINFFAPVYKDIKSKYSIGISSFTPYAKARYSKDFSAIGWLIQPSQQFKYSIKSEWSEETNIYFDKRLETNSIFRTTLHRKTQSHIDGFDYSAALSYYLTLSKKKGFSISQQFWGNSKYVCEIAPEPYSGISNYATFASWRQNIFRKWITLEVQPGISFHRQYEYEANYAVNFYVDFYFGKLDK
ncbi:hypothetical protein [Sulfurimonas sp.]|uniref:hypothetical protein n=1 Tax=Sulfurimonas sp. TaxID=2022749 RepID=UPI0025CC4762|nr:hypothetical protein [Sulfurimonas sp.]MBW6487745.1 hypothetical protein [Sulfurimonas sp.]